MKYKTEENALLDALYKVEHGANPGSKGFVLNCAEVWIVLGSVGVVFSSAAERRLKVRLVTRANI